MGAVARFYDWAWCNIVTDYPQLSQVNLHNTQTCIVEGSQLLHKHVCEVICRCKVLT